MPVNLFLNSQAAISVTQNRLRVFTPQKISAESGHDVDLVGETVRLE